jgi:GHMP kinases N terminal domain
VSDWRTASAPAKLNLALVVGPMRADGKHEVATVLERLTLTDGVSVRLSEETRVTGFADDTLVQAALEQMTARADGSIRFEARIDKRIPIAAGLGGGSSDAAAALRLSNDLLDEPLAQDDLEAIAASLGADVPFFLRTGPSSVQGTARRSPTSRSRATTRCSSQCRTAPRSRRPPTSMPHSRRAAARRASPSAVPTCSRRSTVSVRRRTSLTCRRTTSRSRLSPASSSVSAPSART